VFGVSAENFESKATIDLGTKFKSAGTIYKKKFDSGRSGSCVPAGQAEEGVWQVS